MHANPKGVFFKLGLLPETALLLAGPSNAGLAEPAQVTALSLTQVTGTLAGLQPSLDGNIVLRVLAQLTRDIAEDFAEAHEQITRDEARLRRKRSKQRPALRE